MRILVVIDDYFNQTNGLCISTQRFVKEFRRQGQEVKILSTSIGGHADYSVKEWHIPLFAGIIAREGFHMAWPDRQQIRRAVAWAQIVLIETPFPLSWQSASLARKENKPVIGTFHLYPGNITESLHINYHFCNAFFMNFFRQISFRRCTALQCPTQRVKARLERYRFKPYLYVNTNGIPLEFINNPHKDYVDHPFNILCVGRFSVEKHQEVLLKAINYCQHRQQMHLILAGQGPLVKKYRKLGQDLPLPPVMKLFAPDDLRRVMTKADLVVHCADVEIEGMACMEAFAAGCVPVIADSPLSSTVTYALSQNNRFPAGDAHVLAQRLDYWYTHPQELKISQHRYRKFAGSLTVSRSAKRQLNVMRSLLKEQAKA